MKYMIEFAYTEPRWGDIELEAKNTEEARAIASEEIELSYPEAMDIEILAVKEVD